MPSLSHFFRRCMPLQHAYPTSSHCPTSYPYRAGYVSLACGATSENLWNVFDTTANSECRHSFHHRAILFAFAHRTMYVCISCSRAVDSFYISHCIATLPLDSKTSAVPCLDMPMAPSHMLCAFPVAVSPVVCAMKAFSCLLF